MRSSASSVGITRCTGMGETLPSTTGSVVTAAVTPVVPAAGVQPRLLAGLDDHELAHHPLVLVLQLVAVVHVRRARVGVVGEGHEQPVCRALLEVDRVLEPGQLRTGPLAVD